MSHPPATPDSEPTRPGGDADVRRRSRRRLALGAGALALLLVAGGVWFATTRGPDLPALVYAGSEDVVHYDAEGSEVERIDSPLSAEQQTGQYPLGLQVGSHVVWASDAGITARDLTTGEIRSYDGLPDDTVQPVRGSRTLVSVGAAAAAPGSPYSVIDVEQGRQVSVPTGEDVYRTAFAMAADPAGEYVAASDLDGRTTVVVPMDGSEPVEVPGLMVGVDDDGPVVSTPASGPDDPTTLTRLDREGNERESVQAPALAQPRGVSADGTVIVQEEDGLSFWRPGADSLEDSGIEVEADSSVLVGAVPDEDRTLIVTTAGLSVRTGALSPVVEFANPDLGAPTFLDARGGCIRVDTRQGESIVLDLETGDPLVGEQSFVSFPTMAADPCTPVLQPEADATTLTLPADGREVEVPPVRGIMAQLSDGSAVVVRGEDSSMLVSLDGAFEPVQVPDAGPEGMYWVPTE